ncbi:sugar phosphate isomerase/epimerase [Halieaceae bacterium IMCC8485]|jgi:D-psicose/D-tagatose/L-ribulose 3-epimerase|uniref:Sugar phosphate isomerase/epimerase n=1 Tax=Candidatus Seongchinamella marina TaxID=2518990 RepID=A0ABT3SWI5_9GAMM|nr:sugar phosphate isomerase/epimerase [Candidatus Seongchinamella marina]
MARCGFVLFCKEMAIIQISAMLNNIVVTSKLLWSCVDVKIGMDMRLWGDATGVEQLPVLEMLAAQGYQGVEIPVCGQGRSALKLLSVALDGLGLAVTTSARLPAHANPLSPDEATRRAAVDYLCARVDESATLGSQLLSGGLFQAQGVFSGKPPSDREWEWSRSCLREVADYAAKMGVSLGLEFQSRFDAYLINTAAEAARMCRDVGHLNIGVLYNTFHAHLEEFNPARALPAAGEQLLHVCLSESHRGELGRGQVQWRETFATLDFLNYSGWLMVQALAIAKDPPGTQNTWRNNFDSREQLAADAIQLIQQILRSQRQ